MSDSNTTTIRTKSADAPTDREALYQELERLCKKYVEDKDSQTWREIQVVRTELDMLEARYKHDYYRLLERVTEQMQGGTQ